MRPLLPRRDVLAQSYRLLAAAAVASVWRPAWVSAEDEPPPLKTLFISGSLEYESDASLDDYQNLLVEHKEIEPLKAYRETDDALPGLEQLEACDLAVLFTRRLTIQGESLDRVKRYCLDGNPLVGVRTASHAFQNWLELDREVLGGNYKGHYGDGPLAKISITSAGKRHALLDGFEPFSSRGSLYKNHGLSDDCEVLLEASIPEATEPIAWIREHNGARVFYTSLGHQADFREAAFLLLLTRALFWVAERDIPAWTRESLFSKP